MLRTSIPEVELHTMLEKIPSLEALEADLGEVSPDEQQLLQAMEGEPSEEDLAAQDNARGDRVAAAAFHRIQQWRGQARLLAALKEIPSLQALEADLGELSPDEQQLLQAMEAEPSEEDLAALDPARVDRVAAAAWEGYRKARTVDPILVFERGIVLLDLVNSTQERFALHGPEYERLREQLGGVTTCLSTLWCELAEGAIVAARRPTLTYKAADPSVSTQHSPAETGA